MSNAKTVSGTSDYDPLTSVKSETIARMKAALTSARLDDPNQASMAIRQVTAMRIYHQVTRIVQYLELMDQLEDKLYEDIRLELSTSDVVMDPSALSKLLMIQERIQKTMIESSKLLAPYLDMSQYQAFDDIEDSTPIQTEVLEINSEKRNQIREDASAILDELKLLTA